jgi:hypothetical protein
MLRILAAVVVALVVSGCEHSTQPPLTPSPIGVYVLTAVDQKAPPTAIASGDSVLLGDAVLYSNGAYVIDWFEPSYYFGTRSLIAQRDTGSWSSAGAAIQFIDTGGGSFAGSFTSPTLSLRFRSSDWLFAKE